MESSLFRNSIIVCYQRIKHDNVEKIKVRVNGCPPLCRRTLGWKPRLLRDFSSFLDVDRSFAAVIPDVVVVIPGWLHVVHVVVVVVHVIGGVGAVGAISRKRNCRRGVVHVRGSRVHRERRRLRPRRAVDHRTSGTDAPLGPR